MWESMSPPFFRNPSLKNEGFFVFIGAAQSQGSCHRLFLVKPVFSRQAFFFYRCGAVARLVSPPFFRNPSLKNEGFFVFIGAAQSQGSCRRLFLVKPSLKNEGFFVIYYVPFATLGRCGVSLRSIASPIRKARVAACFLKSFIE